ncbi:MAG: AMP-binding protein [Caldimonas sp.]
MTRQEALATTIRELIERQSAMRPDAVYALAVEAERAITFGGLATRCREVAALLRSHGIAGGDTVSLVMPNGLQTVELLLGALWAGVCVNPVNLLSQPSQMRYVLEHSDCRLVLVAPEWEERVREYLGAIGREIELVVVDPNGTALPGNGASTAASEALHATPVRALASASDAAPSPDALALLMYTSGTTGVPKGVMLTQANLAANARAIGIEHGLDASDRVLAVLPLFHINAFAVTMLAPLAHGGSLAIVPRFSATRFWDQAAATRCTWLNVVPTMIAYLLEGAAPPRAQTTPLRFCRSASAALAPEHLRAFEARFGIPVIETMGLTETVAPAFSNAREPAARKIGSVGHASGCEARVIDPSFAPVPDGTTGELAIRGPNVMRGYYKNEEATRASFTPDGWLRTGDLGHRDADGCFFVTGRIKELIIKGGENIAPREIDEALLAHPAVLEAAAVGIPDPHYGQQILACVVLREGRACSEAELREFCERHLGRYKTPGVFRFVDALPRGPSGKVQRLKLLDG